MLRIIVRRIVRNHPELDLKLKKADSKYTPFQYVFNTIVMTIMSYIALSVVLFLMFKHNLIFLIVSLLSLTLFIPFLFLFWFNMVDVQVAKLSRELDADLMFISEFLLVELKSGLPLGNAIEKLSKFNRPAGRFFRRLYLDFKTGKDLEKAIESASYYSASEKLKSLLKKLRDSLSIGVDLAPILEEFIEEANEYNLIKIKEFSKTINPLVMMYLIIGIVFPSLGVAIFTLGAALMDITPLFMKLILFVLFLLVFLFQYMSYTMFKYKKNVVKI